MLEATLLILLGVILGVALTLLWVWRWLRRIFR